MPIFLTATSAIKSDFSKTIHDHFTAYIQQLSEQYNAKSRIWELFCDYTRRFWIFVKQYELREHQQISVEPGELVNVFIEVLRKSVITFRENWAKLKYKNRNDCI